MWKQACEIYDAYAAKTRRFTAEQIKQFGSPQNLYKMKTQFEDGWNPHTDTEYQEWKATMAAGWA